MFATHQVDGPECHCSVQDPRHIESAWGSVVLVRHDGSVSVLHEKPLNAKLELLYSKSLFLVALNLAQSEEVSALSMLQVEVTAPGSNTACGPIDVVSVWDMPWPCEPCPNADAHCAWAIFCYPNIASLLTHCIPSAINIRHCAPNCWLVGK